MKTYRIWSLLGGNDYIEVEVDEKKIEEALEKANARELAEMIGTGMNGWNTHLLFNPEKAEFEEWTATPNTHLEYPFRYPFYTIEGKYDVPYTLSEALKEGWNYYREDFEPFRKWLESNHPEFLDENKVNISYEEVEELLDEMPDELKEELWEEELLGAIENDISEKLSEITVDDILEWLEENGELIEEKKED